MKNYTLIFLISLLLSSCALFLPRQDVQQGMTESQFLRQNRNAVISTLDGNSKTYRVNRDDRFYILATFQDGVLVKAEEKELVPAWAPPTQPRDGNNE